MSDVWTDGHSKFAEERILELISSVHEATSTEDFLGVFKKTLRLVEANNQDHFLDFASDPIRKLAQDKRVTEEFLVEEIYRRKLRFRIKGLAEGVRDNEMLPLWLMSESREFFKTICFLQRFELQHLLVIHLSRKLKTFDEHASLNSVFRQIPFNEKINWTQNTKPLVVEACRFEGAIFFRFDDPSRWSEPPEEIEESHWSAQFPPPWYVENALQRLADALQIDEHLYVRVLSKI